MFETLERRIENQDLIADLQDPERASQIKPRRPLCQICFFQRKDKKESINQSMVEGKLHEPE